jgi:urea ABC transporter permease protein UrtC
VLALSLGLLWGRVGILSFGQAAFFATGAYVMGLVMQADLGFNPIYLALVAATAAGCAVAGIAGYFLFSAGVRATYFVLVTLALSIMAEQVAVSQSHITGGWNGMYVTRPELPLGPFGTLNLYGDLAVYYVVLPLVAAAFAVVYWLMSARFGKILVGIRENEDRMIALGFRVSFYKTAAFALSGAVAGFAGALYALHSSFVSPSLGGVLFSTEVVVWVAIGGRLSLLGALAGGVLVGSLSNYLSAIAPDFWQLMLGIIFILVIVFFKRGLAGALTDAWNLGGKLLGGRR